MKLVVALSILFLVACQGGVGLWQWDDKTMLPLVPYPASVEVATGTLVLETSVEVSVPAEAPASAAELQRLLHAQGIGAEPAARQHIALMIVREPHLGSEGYRLSIADHIDIHANTDAGLFYGLQTLHQLLNVNPGSRELPRATIVDVPQYSWRGTMLDVARSYLPVAYIKAHIDRMALFKFNRLHLHLSDDQGWRVEIKAFPRLAEIGGASAVTGGRSGFYTQSELRDLVSYAAERHIDIVPEIDLPGHTQAALAAYNELACDHVENLSTYSGLEVGFSKLCLTKPAVIYPFVRGVLTEIADVFPSEYIHIGGDEIKDPLYAEFIERATAIVAELGRKAVAWEEASVADTPTDTLLQLWNDAYDIQAAVDKGHGLILSPCTYTYFDHGNYAGQPNTYDWCRAEAVPLERAYQLNPQNYSNVVGVEAAMWSELVHSDGAADNRLWPRLAATAEVAWSTPDSQNYPEFLQRLSALKPLLDKLGVAYYPEPSLGW